MIRMLVLMMTFSLFSAAISGAADMADNNILSAGDPFQSFMKLGVSEPSQGFENAGKQKTFSNDDDIPNSTLTPSRFFLEDTAKNAVPKISVTYDAGDSVIKLNWKVFNQRRDEYLNKDIKYFILYGFETGNYIKTISVGKSQSHTLRNLTNNQSYFIQIVAVGADKKVLYKSLELQVIPNPIELLTSNIEKIFSNKTITKHDSIESSEFKRIIKQFGYEFFRNSAILWKGIDALPSSDEYLLGPGDSMKLSLWGSVTTTNDIIVDRDGEVMIPKVGAVKVWGLSFSEAKKTIAHAIDKYFRNYEMNLSLGQLRTIQVYVVGDVEAPGSYPISSMATVINALAAAGGPSKNGSLRNIRVTRGSRTLETVDMYDILLTGDRSKDLRLQNGDTIFVPVIGSVVAVAGEVKRPGIYELRGETTLQQALQMAGGITAGADTGRIQMERLSANSRRTINDIVSTPATFDATVANLKVADRDMVKIFPVPETTRGVVSLNGNVARAGEYQFKPGMRLKDLIPSTEILLPETYLESVEITRILPPDYRKELITVNLRSALAGSEKDNVLLQEQDAVKVFSRWDMVEKPKVSVNGAVVNPGVYDYYPGMSVRDLVTAGGSAKRNAHLNKAELSRVMLNADKAEPQRVEIDLGKALQGDAEHNLLLQPDDVLIVRTIADWQDATDKLVTIQGEVRYPGVYTLVRGEKISSVIARAGGYTDKAYFFGAKFTRKSVREQQQKRMDEVIQRTERDITQKQLALTSTAASKEELEATRVTLEGMLQGLSKLRKLKAEGRVVIRIAQLDEMKKGNYDLEMEGGDVLEIPQKPGVIHVLGQVYNPTSFVHHNETAGVTEYLEKAGGPTNDGEKSEIYVIRADGSVMSRQQSSFGIQWSDDSKSWNFGGFMARTLMPGDTVVVPQKIERTAWMRDIKDITQILANVAMTAGSVFLWFK